MFRISLSLTRILESFKTPVPSIVSPNIFRKMLAGFARSPRSEGVGSSSLNMFQVPVPTLFPTQKRFLMTTIRDNRFLVTNMVLDRNFFLLFHQIVINHLERVPISPRKPHQIDQKFRMFSNSSTFRAIWTVRWLYIPIFNLVQNEWQCWELKF